MSSAPNQTESPAPPHPGPDIVEVTAAVIVDAGRVLIAQRNGPPQLAGLWEFPGGKKEPGETLSACLAREIREELGLAIEVGRKLGTYPGDGGKPFRLHFFLARILAGTPRAREHRQVRWVAAGDLGRFCFAPADRPFVCHLLAGAIDIDGNR